MSIRRALTATLVINLVLAILVYGVLFQFYSTDDDVAIRMILEGRMFPASAPSGRVIFINLALGQGLAALYGWAPRVAWYDLFEQALLWLSLSTVVYQLCRAAKTWAGLGALVCAVLIAACMLVEIQFTTVAMAAAFAGCLAIAGPAPPDRRTAKRLILGPLGVVLLVAGASLRLEASVLMVAYLAMAAAIFQLGRRALPPLARLIGEGAPLVFAAAVIVGLTVYHFHGYAADPHWWDFYATHSLRGAIVEYAPVRADPAVIEAALKAASWTSLDYDLLKHWIILDPALYSSQHLKAFLAALPPLSRQLDWIAVVKAMAMYPLRYWYLGAAILALAVARVRGRAWLSFAALNVGFAGLVLVSSIVLKPLPHRVIWPLLAAHLAVLAMIFPRGRDPRQNLIGLGLLVVSAAGLAIHGVGISRGHRALQPVVRAYLDHLVQTPGRTAVTIGHGFPYEEVERPFWPGVAQRRVNVIPFGVYSWSPLAGSSAARAAITALCGPSAPEIDMNRATSALIVRTYAEKLGKTVALEPQFNRGDITAYRCVERSGSLAGG